ncbi:MAG TPA: glycosyl hydrolase [Solirubrobacterales bacterium]|nr:glycosyl hydrolase [Solirubrobacterales bacterium]
MELIATPRGLLSLAAVLAALIAAAPSTAAAIQLGAYTPGAPANAGVLEQYAAMVGRQPDIVSWYREFGQPLLEPDEIANLRATGQTPMVTWEPHNVSLAAIASGTYDAYLNESAAIAQGWEGPLLLRFAHEMNGGWYSWGSGAVTPDTYLAAWRHIVSVFQSNGVGNVKWVWSPYVLAGGKFPIAPYFPGDEWIDYVALDGYNWGATKGAWQSLQAVFSASYALVTELSARPVIIAETGSSEMGGDKAAWIESGFMSTIPQSFPRIVAVVWFSEDREDDWRINSSPASLAAYRAVVNCAIYGGAGPCEGGGEGTGLAVRSVRVPARLSGRVRGLVSFALTEPAQVQIQIFPPRRFGRTVSLLRDSRAGGNRVPLARILHRRYLRAGRYRVILTARNESGRSARRTVHFRVVESISERGHRRPRVATWLRLGHRQG